MTPLRQRMTEDMQVRNLALNTQTSYMQQVSLFARHFNKSHVIGLLHAWFSLMAGMTMSQASDHYAELL